jgi:hypothetical protein
LGIHLYYFFYFLLLVLLFFFFFAILGSHIFIMTQPLRFCLSASVLLFFFFLKDSFAAYLIFYFKVFLRLFIHSSCLRFVTELMALVSSHLLQLLKILHIGATSLFVFTVFQWSSDNVILIRLGVDLSRFILFELG